MAAVRIVHRLPHFAESLPPSGQKSLKHGLHGVVIAVLNIIEHVIAAQPELAGAYGKYHTSLTTILRQLSHV
jgi:hypothetical protein